MSIYLDTAKKQLEKGVVGLDIVKSNLTKHLLELDRQEFDKKISDEYYVLFPTHRDMTEDEYLASIGDEDGSLPDEYVNYSDLEAVPQVEIDYSEDESYVTLEEYKNETRVVSEAVEATYDEDGMELTPYVPEVTELVRPYIAKEITDEIVDAELAKLPEMEEYNKTKNLDEIEKIQVEANGVDYDAHSRGRSDMNGVVALANFKFIKALADSMPEVMPIYEAVYKKTLNWKGADNKVHTVQAESVAEAGIAAMTEYAKVIGAE